LATSPPHRLAPPPSATAPSLASQVLAQYTGAHLTATLHTKSGSLAPVWLQPVVHPQLIVQLSGTLKMELTRQGHRQTYRAQAGSVFLNTAQQLPYELAWQAPTADVVHTLEVNLHPALLRQTATAAGLPAEHLELLAGPCLVDPLLYQLGVSLAAVLQAPRPTDSLYVDTLTQLLATHLVHRHSAQPLPKPARQPGLAPARLHQLAAYVQDSLGQEITLAQLADIACLSPYHFCRVFRQATGQSPHQYVTGQRLDRARHLLQHSPLSVAQVARTVGYHSASHFARLFQRHTGVLPTAWRP
jgi:AraC family transcriptional regulator